MKAVKAVFFDFGNVLGSFNHLAACRKLAELGINGLSAERLRRAIYVHPDNPGSKHETGEISSKDFETKVRNIAGIPVGVSSSQFCEIWRNIFADIEGVEQIIDRIAGSIPKIALSNTDPLHWQAIEKLSVMRKHFGRPEQWVRSFDVGARKPNPGIFNWGRRRVESIAKEPIAMEEILFIDDIPEYVQAFQTMGGQGEIFNGSQEPADELRKILEKHDLVTQ